MSWLKLVYSITESESYDDEDDAEDNADSNRTGSYLFLGVEYLQRYIGMMASVLAFPISFFLLLRRQDLPSLNFHRGWILRPAKYEFDWRSSESLQDLFTEEIG